MAIRKIGIDKDGNTIWEVAVSTGQNPIDGKYHRVTDRVHGSKKKAKEREDELKRARDMGLRIDADRMLFGEFAEEWYNRKAASGDWGETSKLTARHILDNLERYLAPVKVKDVDVRTVYAVYDKLREERGLSPSSIAKHHNILGQIMRQATDFDIILRNPMDRVKGPKVPQPERRSYTDEELALLIRSLRAAEEDGYRDNEEKESRQMKRGNGFGRTYTKGVSGLACIIGGRIDVSTGLRRGEVLGLTWGDVDLSEPSITVSCSITKDAQGNPKVKATKTKSGLRGVSIDQDLADTLSRWFDYQAAQLRKVGVKVSNNTPVVSNSVGGFMNPDHFSRWWRDFRKEHGLEGRTFHEIRHTQATNLLSAGVDIKTVQHRMGHASARITLDWYAHPDPRNDKKAAQMMGNLIENLGSEPQTIDVKFA